MSVHCTELTEVTNNDDVTFNLIDLPVKCASAVDAEQEDDPDSQKSGNLGAFRPNQEN